MSAVAVAGPSARAERITAFLDRAVESVRRHERAWLLIIIAVFLLIALYQCHVTPFWFDEFFTLFISRLPSAGAMLRSIPADGQPPLQYFLTHWLIAAFGQSELALRLPELLAYAGTGFLTWRIARTHGNAAQALFATALGLGGIQADLAYTARPYELLCFFTAMAFACWQKACLRQQRRFLPLCGLALALAGAILSHHFGIVHVGIFLLAGETVRLLHRRRVDLPLLLAIALGMLPLAITLPLAHQSALVLGNAIRHSHNFWARPSPGDLLAYFYMVAPVPLVVAVMLASGRKPRSGPSATAAPPAVPVHEWAAAAALSLLLPFQILIAVVATGYSQSRYAVSCSLGLALLAAWGLPRVRRFRAAIESAMALSVLGMLIPALGQLAFAQLQHPAWREVRAATGVSPALARAPADLPIVVANAFDYPPNWWYASPPLRQQMIYLSDPQNAIRQTDFLPELTLLADRADAPMPTASYEDFIAGHSHFLLFGSGATRLNWTYFRLKNTSWKLTLISASDDGVLFRVDR